MATASSRTPKYNKNNSRQGNGRPWVTSVCVNVRHFDESGNRSGCKEIYCTMRCIPSVKIDIQTNRKVDLQREVRLTSSENLAYIWKIQQNTWHKHFNRYRLNDSSNCKCMGHLETLYMHYA